MIIDTLENATLYHDLGDGIKTALQFLEHTDLKALKCGKHKIDGDNIFIIVEEYNSKPIEQGKWEAHRTYTDIQVVIKGTEKLGYLNVKHMQPTIKYDAEKDIVFGTNKGYDKDINEGNFITATAGDFVIFTPNDAHMPGIAAGTPSPVKKAVVKVKA
ncbi:MAG: DUF386 domain-containing protein [Alphaproteobacteria bacterium]|nr:DUF386 domain-containing protein [Alphaproteobacteria bacterium]